MSIGKKVSDKINTENRKFSASKTSKGKQEVREKEKTLKISIKEASAASVMTGAGDAYVVPYALALNANNAQIGYLTSLAGLIGPSSQIIGSRFMYKYSRKRLVISSVFLHALMWVVFLLLGLLYWQGFLEGENVAMIFIILYCAYALFGSLGGPAWFSLMGDLVDAKERGRYFGKRNRIAGIVNISVTLVAAFILDYTKNYNLVIFGFIIIFSFAAIGRFVSCYLLTKHYYPKMNMKREDYFSFWEFIKKAPKNNFGKFVIFVSLVTLGTNFAAPFFGVYMLEELHYSYTWFTIVTLSGGVFTLLSMPFWGKIGDKYGNRQLMKIGMFMIPVLPLPWIIFKSPVALILTAQLLSGLGWAAFNLGLSNYIYDAVTPGRRGFCVAYFNVINGVGVFIGAILGGLFAQYIHISFINTFFLIFLISAILRVLPGFILFPKIKEVRATSNKKENVLTSILSPARPLIDMFRGVVSVFNFKISKKK
ncbi:MAG: MFS transporter [Candidatus Pacearchaeota archaeon]